MHLRLFMPGNKEVKFPPTGRTVSKATQPGKCGWEWCKLHCTCSRDSGAWAGSCTSPVTQSKIGISLWPPEMREQAGPLASGAWRGRKEWILSRTGLCEMTVHRGEGFQGLLGCCRLPYPNHFCISQSLSRFRVIWCISAFDVLSFPYRALLRSIHFCESFFCKPQSWASTSFAVRCSRVPQDNAHCGLTPSQP